MNFVVGIIEVLVGAFILFTIARKTYSRLVRRSGWAWVAFVGFLAIVNMLIHRIIGSSINPPFFTAVLFATTLVGLTPKEDATLNPWHKRAIYAVIVGTVIGWASYAEVVNVS